MSKSYSVLLALLSVCSSALCIAAPHFGASPFTPHDETDTTFVVDKGTGLDTGCTYRSRGPLVFQIKITRFVGDINADGTLKDTESLIANGVVSKSATLYMPVFDIDSSASPPPPFQPERDKVLVNGKEIGFLEGNDNAWTPSTFDIPISTLKFPARAPSGSTPTPAVNTITINIDAANTVDVWCMSVDFAELSFKAISPTIMIHGNSQTGAFWDRFHFTDAFKKRFFPYDNSINLQTTSIAINGADINAKLPALVKSFGVDSVNLVVHSKGGLDVREYLATYQTARKDFSVVSFTSLSTPHNGSVAADALIKYKSAMEAKADEIKLSGFPADADKVLSLLPINAGYPNLTTEFVASFNTTNIPRLGALGNTIFNLIAGDIDKNSNGSIDNAPVHEYIELLQDSQELAAKDKEFPNPFSSKSKAQYALDVVYKVLRDTKSVSVTSQTTSSLFGLGKTKTVVTLTSVPNKNTLQNDILVTIPSGLGEGSIGNMATKKYSYVGAEGRNHSSIANEAVAEKVAQWIINAEKSVGDLK
jgi:pimeloyl-ACP methyl ester carboxylesterase